MPRRLWSWGLGACVLLASPGCARRVDVAVPATATTGLEATRFAVIASERGCGPLAAELVAALRSAEGIEIDPAAPVQVRVFACDLSLRPGIDVESDANGERRRASVEGRAHGVVAVSVDGQPHAHLIGTSRHLDTGAWGNTDVFSLNRSVSRELNARVAADLAEQISPLPRQVARRVYPNANDGSARHLYSEAVLAEQRGELREALRLARLASLSSAQRRYVEYSAELDRRVALLEEPD